MTKLNWLTLMGIYSHYLNDAEASDGTLVIEFIDKWQGELAFENSVFEGTGAKAEDRWEYERNTKPLRTLIKKAEARVFKLMMKQGEDGRWIAFGRRHPDAEEEAIPSRYLPFLSLDIENRVATGEGMTFRAVRGLIRRQIPIGHLILDQIREAERRPAAAAAARSTEIARAQNLETSATPLPDPAQMHNDAPEFRQRAIQAPQTERPNGAHEMGRGGGASSVVQGESPRRGRADRESHKELAILGRRQNRVESGVRSARNSFCLGRFRHQQVGLPGIIFFGLNWASRTDKRHLHILRLAAQHEG